MRCGTLAALLLAGAATAWAQDDGRALELHGQGTYVRQFKPGFSAAYSGPKSLSSEREYGYSFSGTLFFGARLGNGWEAYFNPEVVRGQPLSGLQGLGGMSNGENQRGTGSEFQAYHARLFVRKTWNLGGEMQERESDANQVRTRYAAERFVLTLGNISVLDVFDAVEYSRDPRKQFLNWASLTYGAWDYPADARGYTWGVAGEYVTPGWSVRAGRFAMPVESNGLTLNWNITSVYGDMVELEKPLALGGRKVVVRAVGFHNRVNAGAFRDALNASSPPDVALVRHIQDKYGVGAGAQIELSETLGAYVRAGWNDGKTETFAFAEIDRSLAGGVLAKGSRWKRPEDSLGIAGYINGVSQAHRDYLAAGGQGFFLGDGRLSYSTERIAEAFYSAGVVRGVWLTANAQYIVNPGYNRDRGPAQVYALRLHAEF